MRRLGAISIVKKVMCVKPLKQIGFLKEKGHIAEREEGGIYYYISSYNDHDDCVGVRGTYFLLQTRKLENVNDLEG